MKIDTAQLALNVLCNHCLTAHLTVLIAEAPALLVAAGFATPADALPPVAAFFARPVWHVQPVVALPSAADFAIPADAPLPVAACAVLPGLCAQPVAAVAVDPAFAGVALLPVVAFAARLPPRVRLVEMVCLVASVALATDLFAVARILFVALLLVVDP